MSAVGAPRCRCAGASSIAVRNLRSSGLHARAETIDSLPTFAEAFVHCRGLLIVSTFNDGKEVSPTKTIQHTVTPRDGRPIAIAVIWERWTNGREDELLTFVMVTVPPNKLIRTMTDRMPAVLQTRGLAEMARRGNREPGRGEGAARDPRWRLGHAGGAQTAPPGQCHINFDASRRGVDTLA
jgi:hypothetical protein